VFGALAAGSTHNYVITATDTLGNATTKSGQFTVPGAATSGPVISAVAFDFVDGFMSWNAADPNGVAGAQLSLDGQSLGQNAVYGPYAAASGVNYAGVFGALAAGSTHNYVITATDTLGNATTKSGRFTVPA
jgi:hypothetical protein